jgi:chromosome segregation ATPase
MDQQPQQQDPTPLIRALQGQRNEALDHMADARAALEFTQAQLRGATEALAVQESLVDDLRMQLDTTKAAMAVLQEQLEAARAPQAELTLVE